MTPAPLTSPEPLTAGAAARPPLLSVVVPFAAADEPRGGYFERVRAAVERIGAAYEFLVPAAASRMGGLAGVAPPGVTIVEVADERFGAVLSAGLSRASGEWIMTLDPDLADPGAAVAALWAARDRADIAIGSRFVEGAEARVPPLRRTLSRALNRAFSRGLSLRVRDMSSGLRLYRAGCVGARHEAWGFDLLQEILVRAYAEGWRVEEVPIVYAPVDSSRAYRRLWGFGLDYARTFYALWKLRNSILAADYDDRAHDSAIPLQRYWQRQRYRHVTDLIGATEPVLDVGCGSSRIIGALPAGSVGVDVLRRKLRYARRFGRPLVHGSGFSLPFPDASFPVVLCSQVIEHVPKESPILDELCRVLAPGGRLVLGTPDYARTEWVVTEKLYGFFAPGGYADEHIAHYTRAELIERFTSQGWTHEDTRYILRGELILAFRKPRARERGITGSG
jgi:dolichol-phosphate mannosyltransferase